MAKRFTDTEIWDKEWFMELSLVKKCLVRYVFDKCDAAGIWSPNWKLASMYIGEAVSEKDLLETGNGLFCKLENGKFFVLKFCSFQYGTLTETCAPHKKVIQILTSNGIDHTQPEGYSKGIYTLQEKEKEEYMDKVEEKEKVKEKLKPPKSEKELSAIRVLEYYRDATGRKIQTDNQGWLKLIYARFKEDISEQDLKDIVDLKVLQWTGREYEVHLVPKTLFGDKHCRDYKLEVERVRVKGLSAAQIKKETRPSNAPKTREEMMEEFRIAQAKKYATQ